MSNIKWPAINISDLALNSPKMSEEEFKRHCFGVFECEPLTGNKKLELSEFKLDAKEYEQRKGLVNFGYSGA